MAFIICIAAISFLTAGIIYFGNKINNYNHFKHTISELGETGSVFEKQVGFGLFLPVSILLAIVALLQRDSINIMGLSLVLAVGYIVAAFFPCDPGSPSSGSWKQQLHNLGGFIEYAGSIYFIMKAAEDDLYLWIIPFKTIGFIVIGCIIITSIPNNPVRGLAQRIGELLIFGCLIRQLL
jgi:Protein of unknown function (DUF998)